VLERNNTGDLSLQSTSLPTWPVPVPKKLPHERSANCVYVVRLDAQTEGMEGR
jgi:hypothetical protein